jgi:nucleotide-binding universal stress UspA family protein
MPLRDILAYIELSIDETPRSESTPALAQAVALARRSGAHLSVVVSAPKVPTPGSPIYAALAASLTADANKKAQAACEALAETAREAARIAGVPFDVTAEVADLDTSAAFAAKRARRADLTVVDRPTEMLDSRGAVLQSLLFESGRPVMIAPPGRAPVEEVRRAVLAWDGSSHAARAAGVATALFAPPASVDVATVSGEKDLSHALPGAEIATHLARHGVKTDLTNLARGAKSVAAVLDDHARSSGADIVLTGAYGHARWRQMLFGGVTRELTHGATTPVVLVH